MRSLMNHELAARSPKLSSTRPQALLAALGSENEGLKVLGSLTFLPVNHT